LGAVWNGLQQQRMRDPIRDVERVWRVSYLHSAGGFTDTSNGDTYGYFCNRRYKIGRSHHHVDSGCKRNLSCRVTYER
jgi:hypothetical protein